jgi:Tol biopolymer transport system component
MKPLVNLVLGFAFLQLSSACGDSSPSHVSALAPHGDAGASGAPDDAPPEASEDGAAGGHAGSNGEDTCESDADCDDALACNGRERCQMGACEQEEPIECTHGTTCVEDGSEDGACEFVDQGSWVVFLSDAQTPALFEPYAIRERLVGKEEPIKLGIPLEPGDWTRSTGSNDWSFDNQYMLFRRGLALHDVPDGLYVVPMGGGIPGKPTELVKGAKSAWGEWSPKRHQLLLSVDGEHELVTLTGDAVKRYSFMSGADFSSARWSPNGDRLAAIYRRSSSSSVFIAATIDVTEDGEITHVRNFAQGGRELHDLRWSPDGKWIAVIETPGDGSGDAVSLVAAENPLTPQPLNLPLDGQELWGASWSPDGRFLAYNEQRKGDLLHDVWIYDSLHPELGSLLVAGGLYYASITNWLPTSSRLLVHVNERKGDGDETWFIDPQVPYDYIEHQSIDDLTQVAWIDEKTAVYREAWSDATKLYIGSITTVTSSGVSRPSSTA